MASTGFSWADEVEKEEQSLQNQQKTSKKPNPFGSARPREVVLEENGVDWRKLDQQLDRPSNLSYVSGKEKKPKEDTTTTATRFVTTFDRKVSFQQCQKGNVRNQIGSPVCPPSMRKQNHMSDVPPLMHLPKNASYLMGAMPKPSFERSNADFRQNPQLGFHERHVHDFDRDWERENMDYEQVRAKYNLNMIHKVDREWDRENMGHEYGSANYNFNVIHEVDREWDIENMGHEDVNGKYNLNMNREGSRRTQMGRRIRERNYGELEEGNMGFAYGMRDFVEEGMEGSPMGPIVNGGRRVHIDFDIVRDGFEGNFRDRRMGLANDGRGWDNQGYECDMFRGSAHYDLKIEKGNLGGKFKKRGVVPTPDLRHYNQRSRRSNVL